MSGSSSSSGSGSFRVYRFVTIAILLWLTICTGWIGDHGTVTAEELEGGEGGGGRFNGTAMHSAMNPNSTMMNSIPNNTFVTPTPGSANIVDVREDSKAADAILYPWLVQLLGCMSLVLLTRFNIPVPYAAVMFIWGTILGVVATEFDDSATPLAPILIDSITSWINIDSATLLLIFLPGLIFKDAVEIPINLFQVAIVQIWILSFPMVLVGTALSAVAAYYCLPYEEQSEYYSWYVWFALGAILASTDPIAVASVLKTAGASPRLVMHISGESLLNDGSSYVFFTIAANMWYENTLDIIPDVQYESSWGWVGYFFQMSVGGTAFGTLFGFGLLAILWELDRRMEKDFDIIQVVMGLTAAYLCYFICDQMLSMSGVIATVALGIVVNRFGRGMVNDQGHMSSYLALADFLLNTLLFALGGTIWGAASFSHQLSVSVTPRDFLSLFVFYLLCFIIRFIQVGLFYPIFSRIGLKSNWKEGLFLAYGGLHGSVGVALGLSLLQYVFEHTIKDVDSEKRKAATIIQFLGGGATLLTLTINGTSAGYILKMLGLVKPKVSVEHTKHLFEGTAKDFVYNQICNIFEEPRFEHIDFNVLKEHVPFVTRMPPRRSTICDKRKGKKGNLNSARGESMAVFNRQRVNEGEHYMHLMHATRRASEVMMTSAKSEQYKMELLVEMRQIFFGLLTEAYKLMIEVGELDGKFHNGFLADVLMQSVELALNEVRYDGKPIDDWKHTEIFLRWEVLTREHTAMGSIRESFTSSTRNVQRGELRNRRRSTRRISVKQGNDAEDPRARPISFTSSLLSLIGNDASTDTERGTERSKITAKRIRVDVLRALAFKHAHKMAEAKMKMYVNRFYDDTDESMQMRHRITDDTLQRVLKESCDQVALADAMIDMEVDDRDLHIINSHYCAAILLRRLQKFTEQKASEGLIGKQEARVYVLQIKESLKAIDPNTLKRLAEVDDEDPESKLQSGISNNSSNSNTQLMPGLEDFLKSDTNPQNSDTVGRSNTKNGHTRNLTAPSYGTELTDLFCVPGGMNDNIAMYMGNGSIYQISERNDEDEEDADENKVNDTDAAEATPPKADNEAVPISSNTDDEDNPEADQSSSISNEAFA